MPVDTFSGSAPEPPVSPWTREHGVVEYFTTEYLLQSVQKKTGPRAGDATVVLGQGEQRMAWAHPVVIDRLVKPTRITRLEQYSNGSGGIGSRYQEALLQELVHSSPD